jgi:hypothetical protein
MEESELSVLLVPPPMPLLKSMPAQLVSNIVAMTIKRAFISYLHQTFPHEMTPMYPDPHIPSQYRVSALLSPAKIGVVDSTLMQI